MHIFWKHGLKLLGCLLVAAGCLPAQSGPRIRDRVGINLAGAEFSPRPGVYGKDYLYPTREELAYYRAKNIRLFRIPFSWERMQPRLQGELDRAELGRLDELVAGAHQLGVRLILDVHGYDRREGKLIGSDPALEAGFADLWRRLAAHYRDERAICAYGLMNEPHDTGDSWPHTAQRAVDAIRAVDRKHLILMAGDHWSGAPSWEEENPHLLEVRDPARRLVYEAHVYFDADGSGVYKKNYDENQAYADRGVERVEPFLRWLHAHHERGLLGEFGVPGDDPRWNEILRRLLVVLHRERIPAVYWAGGPIWHHYALSAEPCDRTDAPQMRVLESFARRSWRERLLGR